ncbi:hypothetical protein IFM89_018401 [Coptis chinensis]|nr:hypothetical protein IFM89_018401 [Coptis chinensis]
MAREEAWKTQEMERLNREHETLVEERLAATTRNAAVIAFLEKVSEQKDSPLSMERTVDNLHLDKGRNFIKMSCSRWPKAEVQALIVLRSDLEHRYQGNIPKGSLWEEISAAMRRFGYNRSAKRCKEKWENINKYFRKVKESNKMRPEDSKTCPYFHQLEALYKDKMDKIDKVLSPSYGLKAEDLVMHMTSQYRHQSESLRLEHMGLDLAAEDLRNENDHENGDAEDVYENVINNPSSRTITE